MFYKHSTIYATVFSFEIRIDFSFLPDLDVIIYFLERAFRNRSNGENFKRFIFIYIKLLRYFI